MDRQTAIIDFLGGEIARITIENAALKAVINELNNELESLKGGIENGNKDI
mgnify:CR=1 FL=1